MSHLVKCSAFAIFVRFDSVILVDFLFSFREYTRYLKKFEYIKIVYYVSHRHSNDLNICAHTKVSVMGHKQGLQLDVPVIASKF